MTVSARESTRPDEGPPQPACTTVLFVDDEVRVLEGMRRMLHGARDDWDMHFAASGADALVLLEQNRFDVVVSDMRMPGMDGVELLGHVKQRQAGAVRLILSGHADGQSVLRAVGIAHQYLSKPCEPALLRSTIQRAFALRSVLSDERLVRLVSQITTVPSMPAAYRELVSCLQSKNASLASAAVIIARDPAMTVKVLQLVNSAYFGLPRPVTAVDRAIAFLGLETLMSLVLGHGIFAESRLPRPGVALDDLWRRSSAVASAARFIARVERLDARIQDDAFLAGMLNDLGTLLMATEMPDAFRRILALEKAGISRPEAEMDVVHATHAEVGAYLVGLWGLPDTIVEAIAFHEAPSKAPGGPGFSLAGIVHAAERLVATARRESCVLDEDWLEQAGKPGAWVRWQAQWQELSPVDAA